MQPGGCTWNRYATMPLLRSREPMTSIDSPSLSYAMSLLCALSGSAGLLLALSGSLYRMRLHQRLAASSRAHFHDVRGLNQTLATGRIKLSGRVRTPDGAAAIKVRIHQSGHDFVHKGEISATWKEASRKMTVRPFHLDLVGGGVVRVEPNEESLLIDDLVEVRGTIDSRIAQAELSHREFVTIEGFLREVPATSADGEGGYRGAGHVWCLRAPEGERLILSTAIRTQEHVGRIQYWRQLAMTFGVLFVALTMLLGAQFWPLVMLGECTQVEIVRHAQEGRWHPRSHGHAPLLIARTVGTCSGEPMRTPGQDLTLDVSPSTYAALHDGDVLPLMLLPLRPSIYQLGTHPGVTMGSVAAGLTVLVVVLLLAGWGHARGTPWYTQRQVVQHESSRANRR